MLNTLQYTQIHPLPSNPAVAPMNAAHCLRSARLGADVEVAYLPVGEATQRRRV